MRKLKEEHITTWNGADRYGRIFNFSIEYISENKLKDECCYTLEEFVESHGYYADLFNTEYMGYLTGQVSCNKNQLIEIINNYFKK